MSGSNLVAIKRRINSIKNTEKITKAMNLVANSKLKKISSKLSDNEIYYQHLKELILDLSKDDEIEQFDYCKKDLCKKKLYIVFTSDMGLCGSFNNTVIGSTMKVIENDLENSILITIGQKGRKFFKAYNIETAAEFIEVSDNPGEKEAKIIVNKILEMYDNAIVGEVHCVYSKYKSMMSHEVKVEKILPLPISSEKETTDFMEFEPGKDEIRDFVKDIYLKGSILNMLLNSKASEQGARLTAMDGASKSARDLLDELQTKYNRIRQSAITEELSEIIGGAGALK